jgi:hypothetical protein
MPFKKLMWFMPGMVKESSQNALERFPLRFTVVCFKDLRSKRDEMRQAPYGARANGFLGGVGSMLLQKNRGALRAGPKVSAQDPARCQAPCALPATPNGGQRPRVTRRDAAPAVCTYGCLLRVKSLPTHLSL